jgi:UDP-N-acetylmuramyl tripeptide synthase
MKKLLKRLFPDTHPVRILGHRLKNQLIALLAGYPAKALTVIGVTGSDGKTTTVGMIAHILRSQGIKAGAVSTAFFEIDGAREPNPTQKTSVGARSLQKFLRRVVQSGCTHVVIEASSHGLMQGRLAGLTPKVAVITNLSMEHLDYHGTMEDYMLAKSLLFKAMRGHGTKVLNTDDRTYFVYQGIRSDATVSFGNTEPIDSSLHLKATNVQVGDHNVAATVDAQGTSIPLSLRDGGVRCRGYFSRAVGEGTRVIRGCVRPYGADRMWTTVPRIRRLHRYTTCI